MKGKILHFDGQEGIIIGEDGKRYKFISNEWKEEVPPKKGYEVDFEIKNNQATEIYLIELPFNNSLKNIINQVSSNQEIHKLLDNSVTKLNQFYKQNFKLGALGSFLIALSSIIWVIIVKSRAAYDIELLNATTPVVIYHKEYFEILTLIMMIGVVLFSISLKRISQNAFKKWLLVLALYFLAFIGIKSGSVFIGILFFILGFYGQYKLIEVFEILFKETAIKQLDTARLAFKGAFITSLIALITLIVGFFIHIRHIPSFFFQLTVALNIIGWSLSTIGFFSKKSTKTNE